MQVNSCQEIKLIVRDRVIADHFLHKINCRFVHHCYTKYSYFDNGLTIVRNCVTAKKRFISPDFNESHFVFCTCELYC